MKMNDYVYLKQAIESKYQFLEVKIPVDVVVGRSTIKAGCMLKTVLEAIHQQQKSTAIS